MASRQPQGPVSRFYLWKSSVDLPFPTNDLAKVFSVASELVQHDSATMQEVIVALASKGGDRKILQLVAGQLPERWDIYNTTILPFFWTITYPKVLTSRMLEKSLVAIYDVLYGPDGLHAIRLFQWIVTRLDMISLEDLVPAAIALAKTLEFNPNPTRVDELRTIAEGFSKRLDQHHPGDSHLAITQVWLGRIRRRLGMGPPSLPAVFSSYDPQNHPGGLRYGGPRHDNDFEDVRQIQILPTIEEIMSDAKPYLPTLDPATWHFAGMKGLLDRHFRLYREDAIGPFRDAIKVALLEMQNPGGGENPFEGDAHPANLYSHLSLETLFCDSANGLVMTVKVDQPEDFQLLTSAARKEKWRFSKRLQKKCLVCILDPAGYAIFCEIVTIRAGMSNQFRSTNSSKGEVPVYEDFDSDPRRATFTLSPVENRDIGRVLDYFTSDERPNNLSLLEIPRTLLGAFRPTLEALQAMSASDADVPFSEYLAPPITESMGLVDIAPPLYAQARDFGYDLSAVVGDVNIEDNDAEDNEVENTTIQNAPVEDHYAQDDYIEDDFDVDYFVGMGDDEDDYEEEYWQEYYDEDDYYEENHVEDMGMENIDIQPTGPLYLSTSRQFDLESLTHRSTMDAKQAEAFVDILSRRFAICQGPPGTGKSHTALQLIKTLLHNQVEANSGIILVVTYTNHALDRALENCMDAGIERIIRIGIRSRSERLESVNLLNICAEMRRTCLEYKQLEACRTRLAMAVKDVNSTLEKELKPVFFEDFTYFLRVYYPAHYNYIFKMHGFGDKEAWNSWKEGRFGNVDRLEPRDAEDLLNQRVRMNEMSPEERNRLGDFWMDGATDMLRRPIFSAIEAYQKAQRELYVPRDELDLRCLEDANIIGVTTSGLARQIEKLKRLPIKTVLIEEAGEILEAHTLPAILPSVQHAILIGDHLQLRPFISNVDLSAESSAGEQYALDMSLFERLVNPPAGIPSIRLPFSTLETQRRMHPSISNLIRQTLYPRLTDAPNVSKYPEVSGLKKRLFWIDHTFPETTVEPTSDVSSTSKANRHEVNIVVTLVTHLLSQPAYQPRDIAVLTPYAGQLYKLRERLSSHHIGITLNDHDADALDNLEARLHGTTTVTTKPPPTTTTPNLSTLKAATVDNFQGEEAKIVIISLVRSNEESNCGFLRSNNRQGYHWMLRMYTRMR